MINYLNSTPDRVVMHEMDGRSYLISQLLDDINKMAIGLKGQFGNCHGLVFGVAMRSSYEWVATLLAIQKVDAVLLPVPIEFSDDQINSLLAKATAIFVQNKNLEQRISTILPGKLCLTPELVRQTPFGPYTGLLGERIEGDITGIIHTSGTTSKPKGVMIRDEAVGLLVCNVMNRLPAKPLNYVSIVPMSLLIEQVLGIFIPILSGGTLTFMPSMMTEYGSASGNAVEYFNLIAPNNPNFLYLPPKLLEEANQLLQTKTCSQILGNDNPHIITGGAKVPMKILEALDAQGINIFEAYGLSENSSIISMNSVEQRVIGSSGTLLEGIVPKFVDGELLINTPTLCAGYYSSDDTSCEMTDGFLHTGDIAEIRDGYLYITGRKKNVIILSTSRNISPEWVESIYKESPYIDDIIVMGEGQDEPSAIILSESDPDLIRAELTRIESRLANFARIRKYIQISDIPTFRHDFYTVTGRPRRGVIESKYIELLYS
ncbi:AMP-dependent synthetase [Zhongshania aliphaticivorans]|uniref:AMP-dependent synthetase n=3 Tax=Zhongshania aliphaticivorans TaxID=1470434 RepID=A0A127MB32_9GAMM|nr:AMP-dependent synthetase [Zhongshania aliphaticivorans]